MTARRGIARGAAAAALVALGLLVGRSVLGGASGKPSRPLPAPPKAHLVVPSRLDTPIPQTTVRDLAPQTAVDSATVYLWLLTSQAPGTTARLRAATLPPLTGQALEAEAAGASVARRVADAGPSFAHGWTLGYRVVAYRPPVARVALWTMGLVQSRLEVLAPQFSTTVCTLRWSSGRWRVVAALTRPGPTPALDGSDPSAVRAFVRQASTFEAVGDAP